jgi:hypothetical protein
MALSSTRGSQGPPARTPSASPGQSSQGSPPALPFDPSPTSSRSDETPHHESFCNRDIPVAPAPEPGCQPSPVRGVATVNVTRPGGRVRLFGDHAHLAARRSTFACACVPILLSPTDVARSSPGRYGVLTSTTTGETVVRPDFTACRKGDEPAKRNSYECRMAGDVRARGRSTAASNDAAGEHLGRTPPQQVSCREQTSAAGGSWPERLARPWPW